MPGLRGKNLRSGDLNEEIGVLLLKAVAAVAVVERQEDVGVDAVATLLRDDKKGALIAEDSFYVQFKSSSARKVVYDRAEIKWLRDLKLPLFIGSIERATGCLTLYSTFRLHQVFHETGNDGTLHLFLDAVVESSSKPEERFAYIGPPIASWSIKDLADPISADRIYAILKPWIVAEQRNLKYRNIGYVDTIKWSPDHVPQFEGTFSVQLPDLSRAGSLNAILDDVIPQMFTLAFIFLSRRDRAAFESVLGLFEFLRKEGIDKDPLKSLQMLWDLQLKLERASDPPPGTHPK